MYHDTQTDSQSGDITSQSRRGYKFTKPVNTLHRTLLSCVELHHVVQLA